jgi:hypothetical protein
MSQKVRENVLGTTDLATSAREQVSVRQVMQAMIRVGGAASSGVHDRTLHPQIWTYLLTCGDVFRTKTAFLQSKPLNARGATANARQTTSANDFAISCRDAPPKLSN